MLEIDNDHTLYIHLIGISQVCMSNAKAPPFFVSSFLVLWDLTTNQVRYQIIGTKQSPTPYLQRLNNCLQGVVHNYQFFDSLYCYDSVFNGDSIPVMSSFYGDIALYL
jgi:hypothetical protein